MYSDETRSMNILGLKVDNITMAESLDFVKNVIADQGYARILTLNAEIAYLSSKDKKQGELVNGADLVTPDGAGIMWASQHYGAPITERVSGVDLTERLLSLSQAEGYSFYCLGAKEETVSLAVKNMATKYGAKIAGYHNGYFSWDDSAAIVEDIKKSHANILLVAMGFPRQDLWLKEFGPECGVNIGIGVGGSFDVFAGLIKRAPQIWQQLRLEWLYRLLKDPRRFKRTLNLPRFMRDVKRDIRSKR